MDVNDQNQPVSLKIVVLGAANVGKTSIMKRYSAGTFSQERKASVGTDFMAKSIVLNDREIKLQIWDTAGQEKFQQNSLGASFYRYFYGSIRISFVDICYL